MITSLILGGSAIGEVTTIRLGAIDSRSRLESADPDERSGAAIIVRKGMCRYQ